MRVACVIPWRGGKPDRERHHETVRAHLKALLPDAFHIDADSGHQPFSRAGSRNRGVQLAEDVGADTVVVCDADTLVEAQPLLDAIDACEDGLVHLPYTRYRSLTKLGLIQHQAGTPLPQCHADHDHENAIGGIYVATTQAWRQAGGQDERFTGWGWEDVGFKAAADTLLGPTVRHQGAITHLWHPIEWSHASPTYMANERLAERYRAAAGNSVAMRALVGEFAPIP